MENSNIVVVSTTKSFVEGRPPNSLTLEFHVLYDVHFPEHPLVAPRRRSWSSAVTFHRKPLTSAEARPGVDLALSRNFASPAFRNFGRIHWDQRNGVVLNGIGELAARVSDLAAEPDGCCYLRIEIRETFVWTREAVRRVRYVEGALEDAKYVVGDGERLTCAICLDEVSDGSNIVRVRCSHMFHSGCFATWKIKGTCPLCRFSFRMV